MANDKLHNRSPKDIDIYAGEQLKNRRQALGMSQKSLAEAVGVTFQQIQKYERGLNRIGASRLYEFCQILDVTPSFFFQDIEVIQDENRDTAVNRLHDSAGNTTEDIIEVIKLYNNIKDASKRKLVLGLLRALQAQ